MTQAIVNRAPMVIGGAGGASVAVALQVHHGLADGAHVAAFFAVMQSAADGFAPGAA